MTFSMHAPRAQRLQTRAICISCILAENSEAADTREIHMLPLLAMWEHLFGMQVLAVHSKSGLALLSQASASSTGIRGDAVRIRAYRTAVSSVLLLARLS